MHEVLHLTILASTLLGAAGLVLLAVWPLVADSPLPRATRAVLGALVLVGVALLLFEWLYMH